MIRYASWKNIGIVAGIIIGVIGLIALLWFSFAQHQQWVSWCESEGGRVAEDTKTSVGTGIDANGNPVTTTSTDTTYYCLSEDGGILDIR